jgi:CheY-like chemotaxis protein
MNLAAAALEEDPSIAEFFRALQEGPEVALPSTTGPHLEVAANPVMPALEACEPAPPSPLEECLALVKMALTAIRARLAEFRRAQEDVQRVAILRELSERLGELRENCSLPEVRALWLVACASEELIKQLAQKPIWATVSTLRTTAAAMDLLETMCSSIPRPYLASDPPVRLLAVDDDPICLRAVSSSLKKAFPDPDVAPNGHSALLLASREHYDAICLDVEMPGMDGFELCSEIHETEANRATPVVFVTSHSDFDSRAKSALLGAHDLIAKPFLTFEITLKILTLVLRARLQASTGTAPAGSTGQPGATAVAARLSGTTASPMRAASIPAPAPKQPIADDTVPLRHDSPKAPEQRTPAATQLHHPKAEPAQDFQQRAPLQFEALRQKLASASEPGNPELRQELISELFLGIHELCTQAGNTIPAFSALGSALEAMLRKLLEKPTLCTASTLSTASAALETLDLISEAQFGPDLNENPARVLVVDDDPISRRAIGSALQLAFGRPDDADSGEAAIARAGENPYDVIFLDVMMPGLDGFATCARIRESGMNRGTPVVFVTSCNDETSRTQAVASGGSEFLPKPVLACQIRLLALTLALRGRLEANATGKGVPSASIASAPSR